MADIRSDFEADLRVVNDLQRWTDSIAVFVAGLLAILLLVVAWPRSTQAIGHLQTSSPPWVHEAKHAGFRRVIAISDQQERRLT